MSKTAKRTSTATTPLAIVGMGCRFPKADSLGEYESNIANRVDGITDVPPSHWNPADYFDSDPKAPDKVYSARGGFLSPIDFNPMELGIAPNAIEATDTTQLFGVLVAAEALRDAGYGPGGRPFDRGRASCILGVTGTLELVIPLGARLGHPVWRRALKEAGIGDDVAEDVVHRISESYVGWQEASFPGLLGNVVAGRIANTLDLGGTNCVVDAACASALSAIHLATLELANGQSDMVVTGGMDTFNDVFMYMCFSKTPALSPTGDARPFSRDADGTILGEGLGCLVLKRLADAERDGDRIYAVIRSMGTSSDGKGQAIYAPSAAGQSRALRAAYAAIGIEPETIDLLEAHGTGTIAGDAAEIASLIDVYRKKPDEPEWCALGSVKSQIGHTKAAAGAAGLIKAALALHRQVLPPTIKVDQPAEALEPGKSAFYVNAEKRPWVGRPAHPRRAGVSSFGFGGSNFHCVLEEYRKQESTPDWDGRVQIVAFSGKDSSEIQEALMALPESPTWTQVREIAARSRRGTGVSPVVRNNLSTGAGEEHGRDAHATSRHEQDAHATAPCRLFLVVEKDGPSLSKMAADARSMFERSPEASSWNTPDGAYFGRGKAPGKLAVVFPGQGSQYAGMLRDLACAFPQMREALETADTVFAENSERRDRLSDLVYPRTAFTKEERERNEQTLRDTRVAQPAIGAMSLGAMNVLRDLGVRPDVAAGHSYGELPALCAAGCFDERALFSLSKLRGELMNNGHGDRGAMLAVRDSLDNVTRVLSSEGIDVVIANKNAPNQAVLSGRTAEIERAAQAFERHNIQTRRLVVSAAFHSALVAEASEPFLAALSRVDFAEARMPVYANTTAEEYPKTADEARTLLAGQLAHPVEFVRQIDNMYEQGARAFLEVGPGNVLTSLVRSILADLDHEAIALDSSRGRRSGIADLARALANLGALGYGVDLPKWDAEFAREALSADAQDKTKTKKPVLTIPICGANYVKPREKRAPVVASEAVRAERRGTGVSPAAHVPISGARKEHGQDAHATLPESMSEALRIAQESMAALQRIQAETAELHRRFLEGQESSQRAFRSLLERQAALLGGGTPFVQSSPERLAESAYEQREQSPAAESGTKVPRSTQEEPVRESRRGGAESVLREVIAEKTGYPAEMLEPHMTLDSDLGIDSIKRVEILSALQERLPGAPVVRPEDLGSLQTLGQIIEFLDAGMGAVEATAAPVAPTGQADAVLREVIAEKTGYPAEMLEPHMTLDSDLGIDSIKRVEILSALQERLPGAPVVRPEELASLQTLGQIVEFLGGRGTGVSPVTDEEHERDAHATPRHGQDAHATAVLLEVVAEKTGYPSEMLELNMSLDSDLGIDSIKRVEIFAALRERLPGSPDVKAEDLGRLRTLGEVVDFLGQTVSAEVQTAAAGRESKPTTPDVESPADSKDVRPVAPLQRSVLTLKDLPQDGRSSIRIAPRSVFCLVGDDEALARDLAKELEKRGFPEPIVVSPTAAEEIRTTEWPANLGGLVLVASGDGVDDAFLKNSFRTLQAAAPALRQNAKENGGALFAAVSRIDGAFGLTAPATDREPLDGALAGLVKTAAHEWPEVACKAIDLAPNLSVEETARRLADEILLSGPVEVGLSASGTRTLSLETAPLVEVSPAAAKPPLAEGDVVVLSGGARGVTAEVAVAMGAAFRPTLVLLGRTPWPEVEPEWLACLTAESEIKKALAQQGGHGISPREIGERYRAIASAREIRSNLGRIEATGAKAIYRSVDVRDAEAVGRVLDEIREQHGPIKALIHGAGVLADRLIVEKTPEQFDRVYDTKVAGLRALLEASSDDPLSAIVLFSSSTGRFGRAGQSDYAMANEALNKFAQRESRRRPDCRVVSVNWGPWNGGMVTASLAKVFEQEGIGLIDLRAGADYLVREMSVPRSSDGAVEIVILGGTGVFPSLKGPDSPAAASPSPNEDLAPSFSLEVDVERFPFLRSHVMDGRAVVPMAMMVEWMAHGAMHTHPGLRFHGFNELRVLKGVILDGLASRSVRVFAGKAKKTDGVWTVHVEMRGGDARGHEIVYARCEVVLTSNLPPAPTSSASAPTSSASAPTSSASAPTSSASAPTSSAAAESDASSPVPRTFYEDGRLFHGPDLQGIDRLGAISPEGVAGRTKPCPPPAAWIRNPLRGRWLSDPLALDSAFQMMVLWTFERTGSCSLPCHARSFRQFQETPPDGARISIRVTRDTASAAWADIEFLDPRTDKVFARLDGYECVIDRSLNEAFRRNEIET